MIWKNQNCRVCTASWAHGFAKGLCSTCYKAERRLCRRAIGFCHSCKNLARPNRVLCQSCEDRDKVRRSLRSDARSSASLKNRYGITLSEKRRLYEEQLGICDVCHLPLPEDFRKSHLDHNHKTGKIRAVLHRRCNIAVGYVENSLYLQVLEYLERRK